MRQWSCRSCQIRPDSVRSWSSVLPASLVILIRRKKANCKMQMKGAPHCPRELKRWGGDANQRPTQSRTKKNPERESCQRQTFRVKSNPNKTTSWDPLELDNYPGPENHLSQSESKSKWYFPAWAHNNLWRLEESQLTGGPILMIAALQWLLMLHLPDICRFPGIIVFSAKFFTLI